MVATYVLMNIFIPGDDNREQDGKKHQIHQPRQYLQLQPQEQQAKKQNGAYCVN